MDEKPTSDLVMYTPSATGVVVWNPADGSFSLDPDALPDESMLVELSRAGFEHTHVRSEPVDGQVLLLVLPVKYRDTAHAGDEAPAEDGTRNVVSRHGVGGVTGATRAGSSGVLYPYRGQRDGQPIYEPPTPAGAYREGGPKAV